jgi:hypothetical protein
VDTPITVRPGRPEETPLLSEIAQRSKGSWGNDGAFMKAVHPDLTFDRTASGLAASPSSRRAASWPASTG